MLYAEFRKGGMPVDPSPWVRDRKPPGLGFPANSRAAPVQP